MEIKGEGKENYSFPIFVLTLDMGNLCSLVIAAVDLFILCLFY